jgi:NADPH:quinone reductase
MRAVRFEEFGNYDVLKEVDLPKPEPGEGEVLVKVSAAAVNPFDNTVRMGRVSQVKPPLVQGNEGSGVVVDGGSEALPAGTRVFLVGTYGFARDGTWQEYVTAGPNEAIPVPDVLDDVEAAAVPVAFLAAEMALRIGCGIQPGQTYLIPGVGGSVANAAIQMAKIKGAGRIITTAGRTEKAEQARQMGYEDVIDLSQEPLTDAVMRMTDDKGVDVALDSIGGDITGQALAALAPGGKVVHMGYPGGTTLTVDSMAFIWKPASIHGFNMYFQPPDQFGEAWQTILQLLSARRIRPLVGKTFRLEEAAEATRYLIEDRPMGKVVLTM